jgi:hypothetical protein
MFIFYLKNCGKQLDRTGPLDAHIIDCFDFLN